MAQYGDLFWLKDDMLEVSDSLPESDILADDIVEEMQTALALFGTVAPCGTRSR